MDGNPNCGITALADAPVFSLCRSSYHRNNHRPFGTLRPVLEQEQALPSAQLQLACRNWNRFGGSGERHADMTGHIVGTFQSMRKVFFTFRNQSFEKFLEVATRRRVGVLEKKQAGTGVPKKNIHQSCFHLTGSNQFRDLIGDFIGAFTLGPEDEFGAIDGEPVHLCNLWFIAIFFGDLFGCRGRWQDLCQTLWSKVAIGVSHIVPDSRTIQIGQRILPGPAYR
jgi:hypothetical protein